VTLVFTARSVGVGVAALFLVGCGRESGSGQVTGFLTVPGCMMAPAGAEQCTGAATDPPDICEDFALDTDFFTLEPVGTQAVLRLQHGGEDFAREDALMLHIIDVDRIRGALGVAIAVGPEAPIRGALDLFETCPDATESLELRGRVTFQDFGTHKGDRVAGTLDELLVRDARTGALRGRLHGDFDFTVRRGPPYRRFAGR
jgi:hypothetical protein